MHDKMAIFAYIFEKSRNGQFSRPQVRARVTFSQWGFRDPI